MKFEVYGPGCPRCQATASVIQKVAGELGVAAEVVKVSDIEAMLNKGILRTPAVILDGQKLSEGKIPTEAEVRQWLTR